MHASLASKALEQPISRRARGGHDARRRDLEHALLCAGLEGAPAGLEKVVRHHLEAGGSLRRGLLAVSSCEILGVPRRAGLELGVACELLHSASLVHDDIQDGDRMRRGRPSVWHAFGTDLAITLGDHFITRAFDVSARMPATDAQRVGLVQLVAGATTAAIRGQVADHDFYALASVDRTAYDDMAGAKSGLLLALPVEGAMLLADLGAELRREARAAFTAYGIAFQIQDDLADVLGTKQRERAGGDLRRGRPSAPAIEFLELAPRPVRRRLLDHLREGGVPSEECDRWLRRIGTPEVKTRCQRSAEAHRRRGNRHSDRLPLALCKLVRKAGQALASPGATGAPDGEILDDESRPTAALRSCA